jgi:hypothetical protein
MGWCDGLVTESCLSQQLFIACKCKYISYRILFFLSLFIIIINIIIFYLKTLSISRLYRVANRLMIMEQLVEWKLAGETEVLGENQPQFNSVHHKTHMAWPGVEPGWHIWEAGELLLLLLLFGSTNCLNTHSYYIKFIRSNLIISHRYRIFNCWLRNNI